MAELNIYQRVNEVRKKIEYIQKDAQIQGYMAVSHDMVTAQVRDELITQGIVIQVSLAQTGEGFSHESVAGTTSNGKPKIRYEAVFNVAFVNIDKPEDRIVMAVPAHADDSGDKAPGKAVSYAAKIAMLKLFAIETGVNDESRLEEGRRFNQLLGKTKEEVDDYLEHGDSLAVFLLGKSVGEDAWAEVYNMAPEGQKGKFKKAVSAAEMEGAEVLKAINQAILTKDAGGAAENMEDLTEGGKRLLAAKLGHEKAKVLGELLKEMSHD